MLIMRMLENSLGIFIKHFSGVILLCSNFRVSTANIYGVQKFKKMSLVVRKQAFCICENKDADQLCGNCEADQRLCFRYWDSTIPLFPTSEFSSL